MVTLTLLGLITTEAQRHREPQRNLFKIAEFFFFKILKKYKSFNLTKISLSSVFIFLPSHGYVNLVGSDYHGGTENHRGPQRNLRKMKNHFSSKYLINSKAIESV